MKNKTRSLALIAVILGFFGLECFPRDAAGEGHKQQERYTVSIGLEITKKDRNRVQRGLSLVDGIDINAYATGFLVDTGLVMTSFHVVSGKLNNSKKKLLGFKPDDELRVKAYVNGCEAKIVKTDEEADLALLRLCSQTQKAKPTSFQTTPSTDERLVLIAQPGDHKMVRQGTFNGFYTFRGNQYWSVRIDCQDGFSGSPVYTKKGEIVGVLCFCDWTQEVALISPATKAQKFLSEYAQTN